MENIEKDTQSEEYAGRERYIVAARVETEYEDCFIAKETDKIIDTHRQVYGPASRRECEAWMAKHCTGSQSREKLVYQVVDAQVGINKRLPPEVSIVAEGIVRTLGWTNGRLEPYVYVQPPPDGIYDFDFVATPPSGPAGDALSPITSKEYTMPKPENFRGVRIHAEINKMEFFPRHRLDEQGEK